MKKFNKFLSVALASAMVMAMAGCGNTDNGSAATGTNADNGSAVQHPAAYLRSVVSDLLPVAQQFMDWLYSTVQRLKLEEINAAGGINGYQVEFKFQDDEADAEKSVNAYNALKVAQIIDGSTTTGYRSCRMCCSKINAAGGINGYQVEFKFQDDEADAEKSVNAYNALPGLTVYHQWSMYCSYRQDQRRQYVPDHSFRFCSRMCSV